MTTTRSCGHAMCRGTRPYSAQTRAAGTEPIDPDGEFCGRRCADQESSGMLGDGACECGHPACQAVADEAIPPM